jgi:hypothetical protein
LPSGPKLDARNGTAHHPGSEFDSNPSQHRTLEAFRQFFLDLKRASVLTDRELCSDRANAAGSLMIREGGEQIRSRRYGVADQRLAIVPGPTQSNKVAALANRAR